jgi:hypothetical protein
MYASRSSNRASAGQIVGALQMTAVGRTETVVDAFGVLFLSIPERSRGQPDLLLLIGLTLREKCILSGLKAYL